MSYPSYNISQQEVIALRDATIGKVCKNACNITGAIIKDNTFTDCKCLKVFQEQVVLIQANIPKKYRDFDFSKLEPAFVERNRIPVNIMRKYVRMLDTVLEGGVGLYIQGSHGLAKSSLAYVILKSAVQKGKIGYALGMSELSQLLFNLDDEESKDMLAWLKNGVQLLVIDEIEKEYKMDQFNSFLGARVNDFFRTLYDNKVSIILTSNLTKKQLRENKIHADNVVDRFEELVDVILSGNSYRKQDSSVKLLLGEDNEQTS